MAAPSERAASFAGTPLSLPSSEVEATDGQGGGRQLKPRQAIELSVQAAKADLD